MPTEGLIDQFQELLLDKIRQDEYPSKQLMDRYEAQMRTPEDAQVYIEVLFEKVQNNYPSLELLDRIARILALLERTEMVMELASGN